MPPDLVDFGYMQGLGSGTEFQTTMWSVVLRAGHADEVRKHEALDKLCQLYWRPLFIYCLGHGRSPEDAEDLTQGFFAHLLARDTLRIADPERGRFRSFLLVSLKRYIAGEWDRSRAARRGGGAVHFSFDVEFDSSRLVPPSPEISPDQAYDRQWALDLVARTTGKLKSEIEASGKSRWFTLIAGTREAASYAEIARDLGITEEAVKSYAKRLRRRFRELLEMEVADTVGSPDEIAAEMAYLAELLR